MVLEVSAAGSLAIALVDGLDPVRLVHPVGDSFVNQPGGTFLDAYAAGSPRCDACRRADGHGAEAEQRRQVTERRAAAASANASLAGATDSVETLKLLKEHEETIELEAARGAWVKLVARGSLEPTHDIVTVRGKPHQVLLGTGGDPRRSWREVGRAPGWLVPRGTLADQDSRLQEVWLDRDGIARQSSGSTLIGDEAEVAVALGAEFRATQCFGSLGFVGFAGAEYRSVVDGVSLYPSDLSPRAYARALAATLAAADSAPVGSEI
jgi:hypothetical protein